MPFDIIQVSEKRGGIHLPGGGQIPHIAAERIVHDGIPFVTFQEIPGEMPDFTDDQGVRADRLDFFPETFPEGMADFIRHVQAPAIDAALLNPIGSHPDHVIRGLPVLQIQLGHHAGVTESLVIGSFAPFHDQGEIFNIVPVQVRGSFSFLHNIPEGKKIDARMVEHTVQYDAHAGLMGFLHKLFQILFVPEGGINPVVIVYIVLVAGIGSENRCHVEDVHTQVFQVIQMADDALQGAL